MELAPEKPEKGGLLAKQPATVDTSGKTVKRSTGYGMGTILSLCGAVVLAGLGFRAKFHASGLDSQTAPPQTYCYKSVQTLDGAQPAAQCFTVANGVFTEVSPQSDEHELKRRGEGADVVTAAEGHVIPGLWDGHGHLVDYGEMLVQVDLFGAKTLDEVRARLRDYVKKHPESGTKSRWLRGMGWDQTDFGRMPTAVSK